MWVCEILRHKHTAALTHMVKYQQSLVCKVNLHFFIYTSAELQPVSKRCFPVAMIRFTLNALVSISSCLEVTGTWRVASVWFYGPCVWINIVSGVYVDGMFDYTAGPVWMPDLASLQLLSILGIWASSRIHFSNNFFPLVKLSDLKIEFSFLPSTHQVFSTKPQSVFLDSPQPFSN